jgi:hypothetical protein
LTPCSTMFSLCICCLSCVHVHVHVTENNLKKQRISGLDTLKVTRACAKFYNCISHSHTKECDSMLRRQQLHARAATSCLDPRQRDTLDARSTVVQGSATRLMHDLLLSTIAYDIGIKDRREFRVPHALTADGLECATCACAAATRAAFGAGGSLWLTAESCFGNNGERHTLHCLPMALCFVQRVYKSHLSYSIYIIRLQQFCPRVQTRLRQQLFAFLQHSHHSITYNFIMASVRTATIVRRAVMGAPCAARRAVVMRAGSSENSSSNDTVFYGGNTYTQSEVCLLRRCCNGPCCLAALVQCDPQLSPRPVCA